MADSRHLEISFYAWPFTFGSYSKDPVVALITAIVKSHLLGQSPNGWIGYEPKQSSFKRAYMYLIHACTIFPIYLQNYSNAINLPITLKALSITDVSHASRRSANSLNRCPMQYVIGFFKGQDKAPTYFPTCFTLFGFNRKARSLFGWAIYTMLSFLKAPQTSKYYIFQPFATVPQNQLMHISPTNFFLCNAPLSGISWAVFLPKTGVLTLDKS